MKVFFQRLALVCLGLLVAGALGEIALRLIGPQRPAPQKEKAAKKSIMRQEWRTGWMPREKTRQEKIDPQGRAFVLRINKSGQRGDDLARRRPDERRILFLGDSFTMGLQLREEDTFVARVGALLAPASPHPLQVINGGVEGFGTYQQMSYYRHYGRPHEPDLVVLCFFGSNDYFDNMLNTGQGRWLSPALIPRPQRYAERHRDEPLLVAKQQSTLRDPISGAVLPPTRSRPAKWLQRQSLLARLIASRYARLRRPADLETLYLHHPYFFYEIGLFKKQDHPLLQTAKELTLESIERLHELIRADGAELLVVLLPSAEQVSPAAWSRYIDKLGVDEDDLGPLDISYPNRLVQELCALRGIASLDLTETFAAVERPQDLYLLEHEDGHFSAAGHELAAARMAPFIEARSRHFANPAVDLFRLGLHHARRGDLEQAEAAFQTALEQAGAWPALHVALGDLYSGQEKWDRARNTYANASELDSTSTAALSGLARALVALGDSTGAIDTYRRALHQHPSWWPYRHKLESLYREQNELEKAAQEQRHVEAALNAPRPEKRHWWAEHTARGSHYGVLRQWQRAEQELQRAIRFRPQEALSHYYLGLVYQKSGRPALARAAYQRALEVVPVYKPAIDRLQQLANDQP